MGLVEDDICLLGPNSDITFDLDGIPSYWGSEEIWCPGKFMFFTPFDLADESLLSEAQQRDPQIPLQMLFDNLSPLALDTKTL